MESMRDIDRAMEREIAKGSCPLKFVRMEFGDSPYQDVERQIIVPKDAAIATK